MGAFVKIYTILAVIASQLGPLANFTFLTKETNLEISDRAPADYLVEYMHKQPGAVESHWLPADPELWRVEDYERFLEARRELLAEAANAFHEDLPAGDVAEVLPGIDTLAVKPAPLLGGIASDDEEAQLIQASAWVVEQGLPEGQFMVELIDAATGDPTAVLDLAWPEGLQTGLSKPVALLLDEPAETFEMANAAGYLYFTDPAEFRAYVEREVLGVSPGESRLALV